MKTIERKNLSKTPAPKVDRIKGSSKNPKGSASSTESANKINLSESIITTLENKREEYNKKHLNSKVALGTLKAVFRRGAGAYSTSHRPTISGGRPNSRSAWAFARVNKFLLKKGGTKVKAAYVQDDDLMEKGAILDSSCKTYISQNESTLKTAYYLNLNEFSSMIDPYGQIPLNLNYTLVTYNSGNQDGLSLIDTINPINLQNELAEILNIPLNNAQVVVGLYIEMGKKLKSISQIEGDNILVIDRDKLVCKSGKDDDLMEKGGVLKVIYDNDNIDYDSLNDLFEDGYGYRSDMGIGEPHIFLIEEGKIIGCIFLNDNINFDESRDYEFDILIREDKRGKGYAKLLIDEMINDFVNKYKKSTVIFANVINDELSKYLVNKYGFVCQGQVGSRIENGCFLTRKKAIQYLKNKETDIKYEEGGDLGQEIICRGCGWRWNTNQSDVSDKYICHRCGFDNRTFYDSDPIGKYHLGGDMSKHLAPNGKPSKLTHELWHLVRTPEFKAWFGDWENDPQNASKVVDENGEPLVVYHGTKDGRFTIFDKEKFGFRTENINSIAFFFTPSLWYAEAYSESKNNDRIKQYEEIFGETPSAIEPRPFAEEKVCFLNIRKPKYVNSQTKDDILLAKDELYDGIILKTKDKISILEIGAFEPNQIKLADGSNTTFDSENPDIRYEEGGKLKKPHNVIEIAEKHEVEVGKVIKALEKGIKKEKEHTTDYTTARTIALHHLWESPKYYDKLKKMEKELNIDEHYQDLKKIYAIGGTIDPTLSFATPSGEPSKLTYLQQVLVRTSAFKNWFGDWESSAIQFIANGRQNYDRLFKNVSKVIDKVTFEPKVVYHGTRTEKEFFIFDVSKEMGVGRPYGYFAHNIEYSQNFTTSSQRGAQNSIPILYQCFINVKNPFYAMGNEYVDQRGDGKYWKDVISMTVTTDKYPNETDKDRLDKIKNVIVSQIGTYIDKVYENQDSPFWLLMARDENKIFKYFLNNYKYDGVFYTEEIGYPYDIDNPAQFTEAVTIFEPSQVKLADGRNLNFDPMNNDIRYEDGGRTELPQNRMENFQHSSKIEKMRNLLTNSKYAEGGEVVANKLKDGNDGKKGGYFEGRSHAEGGIKAYNKDTGQMIEVEGEEVIITKGAVKDPQKREFEGEMLTNREILSRINQSGGGVSFAKGGEMDSHKCGCSGKKYKYGGEMMDDYTIIKLMNQPFEIISTNFESARQFADMLVEKLK